MSNYKVGSGETEVFVTEVTPIVAETPQQQGSWKSGLFSCCKYGCFHPALLCGWCFPTILMGQLLTRMKMTWLGDPTTPPSEEYKKTFRTVVTIVICNFIIYSIFYCPVTIPTTVDVAGDSSTIIFVRNDDCPMWKYNLSNAASMIFGLYTFIVMIRLRMTIRSKYNIPENNCLGCEDCCCIFFCGCCSVVQMAHQTANYDEIRAICCNDTGLPPSYNNNINNNNISNDKTTLTHAIIV